MVPLTQKVIFLLIPGFDVLGHIWSFIKGVYLMFIWKCLFEVRKCSVMRICAKRNEHEMCCIY